MDRTSSSEPSDISLKESSKVKGAASTQDSKATYRAELLGECWSAGAKMGSHALRVGDNGLISDLEDSKSSHQRLQRCFLTAVNALAKEADKKK